MAASLADAVVFSVSDNEDKQWVCSLEVELGEVIVAEAVGPTPYEAALRALAATVEV